MVKKHIIEGTINKTVSGEKQLFHTPQEISTSRPTQKRNPGVVLSGGGCLRNKFAPGPTSGLGHCAW